MIDYVCMQGDTHEGLKATILNPDGTPANLTGATVKFMMKPRGASTYKAEKFAIIVTAIAGRVLVVWNPGDVDTPDIYNGSFVVTYPDGKPQTYPNDRFLIIQVVKR